MRMIHPAAWGGLLLNGMLAFLLYHALENMDLSLMDAASQQAWGEFNQFMLETIRPFHLTLLLAQAAALFLMVLKVPFALFIAFVAASLTIPGSFVYLLGCLLTHYRIKYAEFHTAPPGYIGARFCFPSFALRKMRVFTIISALAFMMLLLMGDYSVSATFFAVALVGLYCVFRAKANNALSLHEEYLTLTVGLFTPRLLIPYNSIRLATLHNYDVIQLDVETSSGTHPVIWPLQAVEPRERRHAVEEMGAALDAHGVPLQ